MLSQYGFDRSAQHRRSPEWADSRVPGQSRGAAACARRCVVSAMMLFCRRWFATTVTRLAPMSNISLATQDKFLRALYSYAARHFACMNGRRDGRGEARNECRIRTAMEPTMD